MQTFEGKFNLYQRQLKDELSRVMNEGTARVIDELNRGPHDKIKNEASMLDHAPASVVDPRL